MKKKILTVAGARPNFMKIAPLSRAFELYRDKVEHKIVHTGQHYDKTMSEAFFRDLELPKPDFYLGVGSGSHAEQLAKIAVEFEKVCVGEKPDLVIVVGDVNSTIAATLTAAKLGAKTAHVEAGLRSFDRSMPEEINRIATDSICDYCFVTEKSGMKNLKKEGFDKKRIFFVGNTMIDSLIYALPKAYRSDIIDKLGLASNEYILLTLHRPSAVDTPEKLEAMLKVLAEISEKRKIVFPIHPRTAKNIKEFGLSDIIESSENFIVIEPVGYIDFLALIVNCEFVMTDSGGIQEETSYLNIPCLTLRTSTERPITVEKGTNYLVLPEPDVVKRTALRQIESKRARKSDIPLWDGEAARRIAKIIVEELFTEF